MCRTDESLNSTPSQRRRRHKTYIQTHNHIHIQTEQNQKEIRQKQKRKEYKRTACYCPLLRSLSSSFKTITFYSYYYRCWRVCIKQGMLGVISSSQSKARQTSYLLNTCRMKRREREPERERERESDRVRSASRSVGRLLRKLLELGTRSLTFYIGWKAAGWHMANFAFCVFEKGLNDAPVPLPFSPFSHLK